MTNPEVVELEVQLDAPPSEVYRYWTEADMYPRWMGRTARLDPNPGGEYFVQMKDGFAAMGTFCELDPPWCVEFSWGWARGAGQAVLGAPQQDELLPPGASRIRVTLADSARGTTLRLEHHDLADRTLRDGHLLAWQTYLARLAIVVTGADPGPDPHS